MADRHQFQYAVLRVVPRVERGECVNVGVILFCRSRAYLAARVGLDEPLVRSLAPDLDLDVVRQHVEAVPRIAAGDAGAGPIAALEQPQRFHWLVAPSSTVVQVSPVHTGLCDDAEPWLDRLFERLVRRPVPAGPGPTDGSGPGVWVRRVAGWAGRAGRVPGWAVRGLRG